MKRSVELLAGSFIFLAGTLLAADPSGSIQPYIDSIREALPKEESSGSYIEKLQRELKAKEEEEQPSAESYIQKLKRENPELNNPPPARGYSEELRPTLAPKPAGGAIQAVLDNRSELHPLFGERSNRAIGIRYGARITRNYTGSAEVIAQPFNTVYGSNYMPDLQFFYEYQPWHSEGLGNFNLIGGGGITYAKGNGQFSVDLPKPAGVGNPGDFFGLNSLTQFQFYQIPLSLGLSFRLNLMRYLRPYAIVAPTLILYNESRNDGISSIWGNSKGLYTAVGVGILLDWISKRDRWDLYADTGVLNTALTIEYGRLTPISGQVSFESSGVIAGFTFEY